MPAAQLWDLYHNFGDRISTAATGALKKSPADTANQGKKIQTSIKQLDIDSEYTATCGKQRPTRLTVKEQSGHLGSQPPN